MEIYCFSLSLYCLNSDAWHTTIISPYTIPFLFCLFVCSFYLHSIPIWNTFFLSVCLAMLTKFVLLLFSICVNGVVSRSTFYFLFFSSSILSLNFHLCCHEYTNFIASKCWIPPCFTYPCPWWWTSRLLSISCNHKQLWWTSLYMCLMNLNENGIEIYAQVRICWNRG